MQNYWTLASYQHSKIKDERPMHFQNLSNVPFPVLIDLLPRVCALLFNLHFLCGTHNCSAMVQSPTHIINHLFSGHSWPIYQWDIEGGIYQRIGRVHLENPVTRKAHKNKKALITLLAQSEWTDCFYQRGESRHHSFWVPVCHLWRTTGHPVQFLFPPRLC